MKILELFAGTASFSNAAKDHTTFTSDFDPSFNTNYTADIMKFDTSKVPFRPDIIWASPPCETFSVASMGHHWTGGKGAYVPKTKECQEGINRVLKTIEIIDKLNPKYWFIENPRGVLRKMLFMQGFNRYTVTYCQYGDTRMKPTDIWSNVKNLHFKPMCKNFNVRTFNKAQLTLSGFDDVNLPCHIQAPRGSSTGTQGIKTYKDRSRIPKELCESIIKQLEISNAYS